ncbi:MAG: YcgL domain-containing protein [Pseudomonadota bacterium]|nr:YcgL domain-containing protein [Pseudomonadota bacterium]
MKIISKIYRSERHQGAYLYTCLDQGLDPVPELLKANLRPLVESMTLVLKPGKSLANADIDQVLSSLNESGFYLQMPPAGFSSNFKLAQLDRHHFLADSDEC